MHAENPPYMCQSGSVPICGLGRFLAAILARYMSSGADDENAYGGFDDVVRDGFELVDFEHSGSSF